MAARLAEATFQPDGDMPGEFVDVDTDRINEALNFASKFIGLAEWAEDASEAHALLASHYLKRLGFGSSTTSMEPTHSRAVGPVSEGPNPSMFAKPGLHVTEYGRLYLMLFETRGPAFGMFVV